MAPLEITQPKNGWILYDGSCGFCSQWVSYWQGLLKTHGFDVVPLQEEWVRAKINEPEEALLSDIRLLTPSGEQIRGANVYRAVMRRVWWLYLFYIMSLLPIFKQLFNLGYTLFNKNRYKISKSCGLRIQS